MRSRPPRLSRDHIRVLTTTLARPSPHPYAQYLPSGETRDFTLTTGIVTRTHHLAASIHPASREEQSVGRRAPRSLARRRTWRLPRPDGCGNRERPPAVRHGARSLSLLGGGRERSRAGC